MCEQNYKLTISYRFQSQIQCGFKFQQADLYIIYYKGYRLTSFTIKLDCGSINIFTFKSPFTAQKTINKNSNKPVAL